jgi:hypothetical protein
MAIVVGEGERFPGGWRRFQFSHRITLSWCDGNERILEAGVDYAEEMPFEILANRLKVMTSRQQGSTKIWKDDQGQVHVIMTRDQW